MALDSETRALIERLSANVENVGREATRAIERVDQTIKHLDDHVAEDRRRFELVQRSLEGKASKDDHDAVEAKVDRVNAKQTWFMGLGAGVVFILTFFKDGITGFFSSGSPPPGP